MKTPVTLIGIGLVATALVTFAAPASAIGVGQCAGVSFSGGIHVDVDPNSCDDYIEGVANAECGWVTDQPLLPHRECQVEIVDDPYRCYVILCPPSDP